MRVHLDQCAHDLLGPTPIPPSLLLSLCHTLSSVAAADPLSEIHPRQALMAKDPRGLAHFFLRGPLAGERTPPPYGVLANVIERVEQPCVDNRSTYPKALACSRASRSSALTSLRTTQQLRRVLGTELKPVPDWTD